MTPGETLVLQLEESQKITFGWRWVTGDTYPVGSRLFFGSAARGDHLFRTYSTSCGKVVDIDIKPGSDRNPINLRSRGKIPVAILTSSTFDATQVDWETVQFGPGEATESHERIHVQDVDYDGDMDVVLHFKTQETGIVCSDTEATLTGETFAGDTFSSTDVITVVKCPK